MALLKPCPTSTTMFTYDARTCTFATEASSLDEGGRREWLERVYDDACDLGLTLVSHTTGAEIVFAVAREVRDAEGDLVYTELRPARSGQGGMRVVVYND
jgi:hypothetical protein